MSGTKSRNGSFVWLRTHLFSGWINSITTSLLAVVLFLLAKGIVAWMIFTAKWNIISLNLRVLMVGQYPVSELWRIWLALSVLMLLLGLFWGIRKGFVTLIAATFIAIYAVMACMPFVTAQSRMWLLLGLALIMIGFGIGRKLPFAKKIVAVGWLLFVPISFVLLSGAGILPSVSTNLWGGFLLSVLIASVTMIFSFPIGILLALGRRSKLVVVKWFCIGYIEIVRGIPLVAVFFMAQLLLPLFLGEGVELSNVLRAMIAFSLFTGAYVAETIRGGLQSIPRGQFEAAEALGLSYVKKMTFIIMPQALRNVIPALVGIAIEVFKDTTFVTIVSLMDLMGITKRIMANPQFLGRQMELFVFVSVVFLIFCLLMSKISKRLETSLGTGKR